MWTGRLAALAIAAVMLAGCATGEQGRGRPAGRPADPLEGLPDGDKTWYRAWQRARADSSTFALRERVRLAQALVADPNMAARLSGLAPPADVDARMQEAFSTLLRREPTDASVWYAHGLWKWTTKGDAKEAGTSGCYAAKLTPDVLAYEELCGDGQALLGDPRGGTEHLTKAYALAQARPDQCRLFWKIRAVAPDPDAALASVSPHIVGYCEQMRQEAALQAQTAEQRRMQRASCTATCQAGYISCPGGSLSWWCSGQLNACTANYGIP